MESKKEGRIRMEAGGSPGATANICINDVVSFCDAEKVMYCRLCATVNNDAVSIFGEEGVRLSLADKINIALPIWVSTNMGPPLHVCRKCIENLDITVKFINQVVAAQKKINTVFKVLQDISKRNVPTTCDRDPSIPAFITYFRSKNFKKLEIINQKPNNGTEEENEGGKHKMVDSHITKTVDDSVISLALGKNMDTVSKTTTSNPPFVGLCDDDSSAEDDVRDDCDASGDEMDFEESVDVGVETNAACASSDEAIQVVANQMDHTSTDPKVNTTSLTKESANMCKYCHRTFKWNTELLFHHTSVHQDAVFCCRVCFKVFYDDKEEFKKHVRSHSVNTEAGAAEVSHESTLLNSAASNVSSMESSCDALSQNKNREKVDLTYICKYCTKKYSKLHDLFSHQTEDHSDLVFRCTYCSKVFYENEEELLKHEESHGLHRSQFKLSEGNDADHTQAEQDSSFETTVVQSSLTEKQQEWVNKILGDRYKKKSSGSCVNTNVTSSVNANGVSTSVNADANISTPIDPKANISPSVDASDISSPSVNVNGSATLDKQVNGNLPVTVGHFPTYYTIKVIDRQNVPHTANVSYQRVKTFTCRPCQVEFKTEEERELHRLFHHRLKLPCRYCPRSMAHKSKLVEHETIHFKKPKLDCKKCGEEFDNSDALKRHKRSHCHTDTLPRFSCQICKRLYIRESELKIHLETHLDERPFLCEKCGQCFKDISNLKEHRSSPCKSKGFTRGYECDICEKKFHNARLLASHRIHQHRAMYPCPLCGLVFRSRPAMGSHMKTHSRIFCLMCDEEFEKLDLLQSHRKQKHPEEDMTEFAAFENVETNSLPRLMCEVCDKCFATELTLNVHKATHSNELAWQCHLCEEKFHTKLQLEIHMSSHPGERPYKCNICDLTFTLKESLLQHEKVHFQEKCHTCDKCAKSFSTTLELSKHMAIHLSYDAFTCSFCPMSFSRKNSLLIHQRTHTNKVYSCSICSENFSQLKLAEQHERTHARNKKETPMTSTDMDEDYLAESLLNMSEAVVGVSSDEHVLEEVVTTVEVSTDNCVDGKEEVSSSIIIDPEYSEVVYISNALDVIL